MQLNGQNLISLPIEDTKVNYLSGFWSWVDHLASDNYELAIESLYWKQSPAWTPNKLKGRIRNFFGDNKPWVPIIPNQRLINAINDAAEIRPRNKEGWGWIMAQIPVTTQPRDPKDDNIPLMGLATSFFIREHKSKYVLDFEIFHL